MYAVHPGPTVPRVNAEQFAPVARLASAQRDLDERGLRATGSPEHDAYVHDLAARLEAAGASDVALEPVPLLRWTPQRWALSLSSREVARAIPVVSYVAYSGRTDSDGVSGPLASTPHSGVIGLVDIPVAGMPARDFDALDWDAPAHPRHDANWDPEARYDRVWLSQDMMREALQAYEEAGASGLILIVDIPEDEIPGAYLLYDGVHRNIPALFVGRSTGSRLREAQATDPHASVTLVLQATVEEVVTHNVVGLIRGATDELVALQSHTDGPNGLEDNGPEAIIAMAEYLSSRGANELPRGVLVLLTTGHFATHQAWGIDSYLRAHQHDVVPRVAAALSIEHLGALARQEDYPGQTVPGVHEFGCFFATPHRAMIDAGRLALERAAVTDPIVLRPFVPDTSGESPDGTTWPGDGGPFWHHAGLPTLNFITGPGYTFNVEPVLRYIDVEALRSQAIAFTELVIELAHTPWDELREPAH